MNIIMLQDDVVIFKEDSDSETPTSSCSGVQPSVSEQNEQLIPLTFSAVESGVEVKLHCLDTVCDHRKTRLFICMQREFLVLM
jgi:hypothetical protein